MANGKPNQRLSSMFDTSSVNGQLNGANSFMSFRSSVQNSAVRVVYAFSPEASDEIRLNVGDTVDIIQEFDDGWAQGKNMMTNQSGLFPLDCLDGYADPNNGAKPKQRISSVFGGEQMYGGNTNTMNTAQNATVLFGFSPEQNDEIALRPGDQLILMQAYDDGWGFGINISTQQEGLFPLDCLDGYADPSSAPTKKQRLSSVYSAASRSSFMNGPWNS